MIRTFVQNEPGALTSRPALDIVKTVRKDTADNWTEQKLQDLHIAFERTDEPE